MDRDLLFVLAENTSNVSQPHSIIAQSRCFSKSFLAAMHNFVEYFNFNTVLLVNMAESGSILPVISKC